MRLQILESGHTAQERQRIERWEAEMGMGAPGTVKITAYRSDFFGKPFAGFLRAVRNKPSDWTLGQLEIFSTLVSRLNQCPY